MEQPIDAKAETAMLPGAMRSRRHFFDAATISDYARSAGDMNPLHHDPDYAAHSRFGGVIASGAHMSGVLMGFGATFISDFGEAVGLEFSYRFLKAVPAGMDAILAYTILSVEPHPKLGGTVLTFEGSISNDEGTRFVTSTGKAVIFDKRIAP